MEAIVFAAIVTGMAIAIAWTILPFILFARLKRMIELLESIDANLSHCEVHDLK